MFTLLFEMFTDFFNKLSKIHGTSMKILQNFSNSYGKHHKLLNYQMSKDLAMDIVELFRK